MSNRFSLESRDQTFRWAAAAHPAVLDHDRRVYCRAANAVIKWDDAVCCNCPLYAGDAQEVHCIYYDLGPGPAKAVEEAAAFTEGLIMAGITTEFPAFLSPLWKDTAARCFKERYSDDEWLRYEEALQFAAEAHKGSYRKGTKIPYIVHPVEVSWLTAQLEPSIDVVIAAALHDVVEDTKFELSDISSRFGDDVARLVQYESEDKRPDMPAEASWRIRKEEFLAHLDSAPVEAKMISLADKLSNICATERDHRRIGDRVWLKFNQKDKSEQEWYYRSIAESTRELQNTALWREYLRLCDELFPRSEV